MRPRKRILLLDSNAERAALTRYMLHINFYKIYTAHSPEEAAALKVSYVDLVLGYWPLGVGALDRLKKQFGAQSTMIVAPRSSHRPLDAVADAVLAGGVTGEGCTAAIILERVQILTCRKRGPKVGSAQPWRIGAPPATGQSGFKGVTRSGPGWRARFTADRKRIYVGCFETPELGNAARNDAIEQYHRRKTARAA
jgi:hypothetical protein